MRHLAKIAAVGAAVLLSSPALAWEPTKPVEIVVAAGAGGASDQMARMIQAAVQKNNLMKQPIVVSLKGAASGAEALIYMKSSDGDPNKVLIAYSLIYMLPLSAKIPFNWRDLSPVAVIAMDQFVLWDNAGKPYKNVKEFIDAAKAASTPFKMGGTGSKREDQVLTVFMEKKTGAKFVYLPYTSGGEVRGGRWAVAAARPRKCRGDSCVVVSGIDIAAGSSRPKSGSRFHEFAAEKHLLVFHLRRAGRKWLVNKVEWLS